MGKKILKRIDKLNTILKKILIAILFLVLLLIGFIRNTTFLVVNTAYHKYPFPYNKSYIKPPDFLYEMSKQSLASLKWMLTFGFSIIFGLATYYLIKYYFNSRHYNRAIILIYVLFIGTSFVITLAGYVLGFYDDAYYIGRIIAGFVQSPILSFILFLLFYFVHSYSDFKKPIKLTNNQ